MSAFAEFRPLPASGTKSMRTLGPTATKAALILTLWIGLGVLLALLAPKAADTQPPLAGPIPMVKATPPSPI